METMQTEVADLYHRELARVISRAGLEALKLDYPQVAQVLLRLATGKPLAQIVLRGGLVQDVHGLPNEILLPDGELLYEVLDYDDLECTLEDDEIAEIYRRARMETPADPGEALDRLDKAFARLEWSAH